VAIAGFPSVEHAVKAVGEVINSGVPIRESSLVEKVKEEQMLTSRLIWSIDTIRMRRAV
jgi:hypothetical protein